MYMNNEKIQIDTTDKKILSILMDNARTSYLEIARKCRMSGAAIHQRIKKLDEAGIITGWQLKINPGILGYNTSAYMGIFLEKANMYESVINKLSEIPEILECHYTTGNYALFLKILCRDNKHLMEVLSNSIQKIPGVTSTETFISLDISFEKQIVI